MEANGGAILLRTCDYSSYTLFGYQVVVGLWLLVGLLTTTADAEPDGHVYGMVNEPATIEWEGFCNRSVRYFGVRKQDFANDRDLFRDRTKGVDGKPILDRTSQNMLKCSDLRDDREFANLSIEPGIEFLSASQSLIMRFGSLKLTDANHTYTLKIFYDNKTSQSLERNLTVFQEENLIYDASVDGDDCIWPCVLQFDDNKDIKTLKLELGEDAPPRATLEIKYEPSGMEGGEKDCEKQAAKDCSMKLLVYDNDTLTVYINWHLVQGAHKQAVVRVHAPTAAKDEKSAGDVARAVVSGCTFSPWWSILMVSATVACNVLLGLVLNLKLKSLEERMYPTYHYNSEQETLARKGISMKRAESTRKHRSCKEMWDGLRDSLRSFF